MAWVYAAEYVRAGSVTAWREVQALLNNYAREANGLTDRDNLPAEVAVYDKVESNAFNEGNIVSWTDDLVLPAGSMGGWVEVPGSVDEIEVGDGAVEIDAWIQSTGDPYGADLFGFEWMASMASMEMRVRVDGRVVAETGWVSAARTRRPLQIVGGTPVGAGTVRLSMEVRAYGRYKAENRIGFGVLGDDPVDLGPTFNYRTHHPITFSFGAIVWRHVAR